ncbi:MAG: hypothetical protein RIR73_1006 [Chloroflexota bacterium]
MNKFLSFFAPPVFADEEKTRSAELVNTVLVTQIAMFLLALIALPFAGNLPPIEQVISGFMFLGFLFVLLIPLKRGYVAGTGAFVLILLTLMIGFSLASAGTIRHPLIAMFLLASIFAGLAMGRRAAIISIIFNIMIVSGIAYGEINGLLSTPEESTNSQLVVLFGIAGVLTIVLLNQALRKIEISLNLAKEKQNELTALNLDLEKRVTERTRALTTSTEVSRRLSTILDLNQLVKEVVEQVKNAFNYYHAHIYLMDEYGKELIMAGGTGDAGQMMLARGHKIQVGKGLVGLAAETGEMIRVSDTTEDPDWLPNPLLPETKSEVAIPIVLGEKVIGVLDVQQNLRDGLSEEDAVLLQSIAYQVAVAVRNAQIFSETQQQAEREALINEIGRKIQNTASVEQALQVAARELGQALGARDSHAVIDLHGTLATKAK